MLRTPRPPLFYVQFLICCFILYIWSYLCCPDVTLLISIYFPKIVLWSVTGPERLNAAVRIISINVPGKWEERAADLTPLFCIKLSVFPFLLNKVSQPVSLHLLYLCFSVSLYLCISVSLQQRKCAEAIALASRLPTWCPGNYRPCAGSDDADTAVIELF